MKAAVLLGHIMAGINAILLIKYTEIIAIHIVLIAFIKNKKPPGLKKSGSHPMLLFLPAIPFPEVNLMQRKYQIVNYLPKDYLSYKINFHFKGSFFIGWVFLFLLLYILLDHPLQFLTVLLLCSHAKPAIAVLFGDRVDFIQYLLYGH